MSNGYRNGAFAVGLVVGFGVAVNLFFWLGQSGEVATHKITNQTYYSGSAEVGDTQYKIEPNWDGLWGFFVSPNDTLAQWIMAVLALFAVLISVVGVKLIWETLKTTNQTNDAAVKASQAALEANRIMRAEQRPWVQGKVGHRLQDGENKTKITIDIEIVSGTIPAKNVMGLVKWYLVPKDHMDVDGLITPIEDDFLDQISLALLPGSPPSQVIPVNAISNSDYQKIELNELWLFVHYRFTYEWGGDVRETEEVSFVTPSGGQFISGTMKSKYNKMT